MSICLAPFLYIASPSSLPAIVLTCQMDMQDAAHQFKQHVAQAVQRKCSDFSQISVLLSGGLDSAIIAKEAKARAQRVQGLHWT
jgi:asparagine synthetase B (glutamine-hydrolysing)